jgi:hypothetical protein
MKSSGENSNYMGMAAWLNVAACIYGTPKAAGEIHGMNKIFWEASLSN